MRTSSVGAVYDRAFLLMACLLLATTAFAEQLSGPALVKALQRGGNVIVMRHASSPRQTPDRAAANPDNVNLERQLDETGRATAAAMGKAIRDLKIPIGEIWTSPTYRAIETIRLAKFDLAPGYIVAVEALGDGGQSMQASTDAQSAWLQKRATQAIKGTNVLLVTHMPNLSRAFPSVTGVADGEALIYRPDGKGGADLVGRIKIEDWPRLQH
jgi:phosphohistidine phosphatase SixA